MAREWSLYIDSVDFLGREINADDNIPVVVQPGLDVRRAINEDFPAAVGGGTGSVTVANLPAGSMIDVYQTSGGTWAARPTARTDVRVNWVGYPGLTSLPSGGLAGKDSYVRRTTS